VTSWLDGKHVVFGEVADEKSYSVVKEIEAAAVLSVPTLAPRLSTVVSCKQWKGEDNGFDQKGASRFRRLYR